MDQHKINKINDDAFKYIAEHYWPDFKKYHFDQSVKYDDPKLMFNICRSVDTNEICIVILTATSDTITNVDRQVKNKNTAMYIGNEFYVAEIYGVFTGNEFNSCVCNDINGDKTLPVIVLF